MTGPSSASRNVLPAPHVVPDYCGECDREDVPLWFVEGADGHEHVCKECLHAATAPLTDGPSGASGRRQLTARALRNVPPAQRLLRDGGLCSLFWRLDDGTPVICAIPTDVAHEHPQKRTRPTASFSVKNATGIAAALTRRGRFQP